MSTRTAGTRSSVTSTRTRSVVSYGCSVQVDGTCRNRKEFGTNSEPFDCASELLPLLKSESCGCPGSGTDTPQLSDSISSFVYLVEAFSSESKFELGLETF